jgi:hypothetical protein
MTGVVLTTCLMLLAGAPAASPQEQEQDTQKQTRHPLVLGLPVRVTELEGRLTLPVIESAVIESGGWVFLFGGMTPDFKATPAIQTRRPDGDWLPVGSQMREARINPEALLLPDGQVFIWGGYGGSAKTTLTLRIDGEIVQPKIAGASKRVSPPEGSAWITPSPPKLLADGSVGVIAGSALHRFDCKEHRWLSEEPLGRSLSAATLDVLQDGTLIACGTDPTNQRLIVMHRTQDETLWQEWTNPDQISALGARSHALPDERLLLLGWPGEDGRPLPETLVIDPGTQTIGRGPKLPFQGGIPTWLDAIVVSGGVLVLASEQPTRNALAIPTAVFIRAESNGSLRPWRLNNLPRRRRPNVLSVGIGTIELFGGYRFATKGATMVNGTSRVNYGIGLIGD